MGQPECKIIFSYISPNGCDQCVKTNFNTTSNTKWPHHIGFDNPNSIFYEIKQSLKTNCPYIKKSMTRRPT